MDISTVAVDPYHPQLGGLAHMVMQRLAQDAEKLGDNDDSVITGIYSRLVLRDPTVLVLAALNSKTGQLVGYTAISIEGNRAYMLQPRFDQPTEHDATGEFLSIAQRWIKDYNSLVGADLISTLTLVARRFDAKWAKKYGFETKRYLMEKSLGV